MKISDLKKEEVIKSLIECKTKIDFLRKYGYKNGGAGYRFVEEVSKYFDIDIYDYIKKKMPKEKYDEHPSYCQYCGKILEYNKRNNKFCSCSCAASYNNTNREVSFETRLKTSKALLKKEVSKEIKTCKFCNKTFIGDNDFCSNKCKKNFEENEKIERWLNGENFLRGNTQVPTFIRNYLLKKYNYKCQICGWSKKNLYTNTIPLHIHHIDGDCTNNKKENLQLLCPNCHSLTENFGILNKNSKRFHRPKIN